MADIRNTSVDSLIGQVNNYLNYLKRKGIFDNNSGRPTLTIAR